ncbi:hypothetical protein NUW54_g5285 [Trametes sanguinea]|uniref:Uncharacterized protein n=1 Tax=Trametes sanguinea TaxID=158606 RepID=A0ACC1PWJ7_9APHY|nr:hypothetical protein NUW54_g5285 [Trametes sanguinea]
MSIDNDRGWRAALVLVMMKQRQHGVDLGGWELGAQTCAAKPGECRDRNSKGHGQLVQAIRLFSKLMKDANAGVRDYAPVLSRSSLGGPSHCSAGVVLSLVLGRISCSSARSQAEGCGAVRA